MNIFRRLGQAIVKGAIYSYFKVVHRLVIVGKENIPKEGNFIFCGNHRSFADAPIMVVTCGRDMRFFAKEELRKNPFFRFLGFLFEAIYVKRDSKDITAMKEAIKTLKNNKCIGLFPEGTRNGLEKNEGHMKSGAAYMALKTNTPIIPVGIVGDSKGFSKMAIVYGTPIDYSEKYDIKADKEAAEKATEELKDEIIKLAGQDIKLLGK